MALKKLGSTNARALIRSGASLQEMKDVYIKRSYRARQRMKQVAAAFPGSETVTRHQIDFRPAKELKGLNKKQMALELAAVNKYMESASSKVGKYGQVRQDIVNTFQANGYDVTEENLDTVTQFLEDARQRGLAAIYPSDMIVDAATRAYKKGLSREDWEANLEYWMTKSKAKERLYLVRRASSSDDY